MNGKIDNKGVLYIERGRFMKKQYCINGGQCSDNCSHFGEPLEGDQHDKEHDINHCLTLCHTILEFKEFTDERKV